MAKETSATVVNPFNQGVTYKEFLSALGSNSVAEYLAKDCTKEQINFIENELVAYKFNEENKTKLLKESAAITVELNKINDK